MTLLIDRCFANIPGGIDENWFKEKAMTKTKVAALAFFTALPLALVVLSAMSVAQSGDIKGVINGRNGATMTVQSQESGKVVVVLTDGTQVDEVEGGLHLRKKQMGLTALMPGLPVEVKGTYNSQNQLLADTVRFRASDLKSAVDMQASVAPAQQEIQVTQQKMAQQEAQIQQEKAQMAAAQAKIDANKAAIAAANKRFGELGDYNILGEVTVLFANGKVTVEPQYQPQLLQLAQKAKTITGYVILVKGYASAVGSAALNQRLSTERADNVTDFLEQQGGIPLTNMLAPGAMGTSQQVAPDTTTEGQAENRRVVVSILQNKGIAGT
jgi:outer membrane protein OmpA-like peptidoglycan-associated protein